MFVLFKFFSKPHSDSTRRSERAQGLLEFGLILPLLLLFLFGVIEVGRMLAIYSSVSSASRQAARYGAVAGEAGNGSAFYLDCAGMRRKAQSTSFLQPLANADISIRYDHGLITQSIGLCATNAISPTLSENIKDGDRVVISITTTYKPLVPIVPLPALPMTFSAAHTIFTTIVGPTPTPLPNPDLKITKVGSPTRLLASDPGFITYTILVTNTGPSAASSLIITDTLPTSTSVSSIITPTTISPNWTCTWSGVNITCKMPYLGSGNVAPTITVKTAIAASARVPGIITNTAWLSNALSDSAPADNIAKAGTIISTWVDLELTKISLVNPVAAGSNITYELAVKNNNWVTATVQVVTDTLPASATFVSFSGSGWSMSSGAGTNKIFTRNTALPAGSTAPTITIVMQAPNPGSIPACNCLINTASAGTTIGDPFPDNNTNISNTTSISTDADLVMFKSASQSVVNGGNTYSYTLHVTNNGPSVVASVVVTDPIPAGVTIQSISAGAGWTSCGAAGQLVTCNYTTVLPVGGVTPNIIITVQSPVADATIVNTATVSSTQTDPVPGNNSASATTTANNCHHDLVNTSRSSISASPTDVAADNSSTTRITVTLRDACDVVIVSPPYSPFQVTLSSSRGVQDTITTANPATTSTGVATFDVKSAVAGTSTYSAVSHDTLVGANPDQTIASATVNWYGCVGLGELPLGSAGQTFLEFTLDNASGMNRKLVGVSLTYPGGGNITQLTLEPSTGLWSGSGTSPFSIGSGGWTAGTDAARTISNGAPTQILKLDFSFGVSGPLGSPNTYVFTTNWTDDTGGRPCSSTITVVH